MELKTKREFVETGQLLTRLRTSRRVAPHSGSSVSGTVKERSARSSTYVAPLIILQLKHVDIVLSDLVDYASKHGHAHHHVP